MLILKARGPSATGAAQVYNVVIKRTENIQKGDGDAAIAFLYEEGICVSCMNEAVVVA